MRLSDRRNLPYRIARPASRGRWSLALLLALLPFCIHRNLAAQNAEIDTGEDISFEIRPLTVLRMKSGSMVEGVLLEHDDKSIYRIKMRRPAVTRDIPREDVAKLEPALTPVSSVSEQFKRNPSRIAGVARKALRFFRGNREVEKVVSEQLELASGRGDADAMALLIERKILAAQYESAEHLARELIRRKNSGIAQALLGKALGAQSDKREAADKAFEEALKLAPENEIVMVAAAEFLLDTGRPEKAREIFTNALARNPESVAALVGAGYVCLRQGMLDQAVTSFDKARAAIPQANRREQRYIAATLGLASAKALKGQPAETMQLASEVLTLDTSNARAYGLQAYARLIAGGETESQAIGLVDYALKSDPENPRFKLLKARALARQGMFLKATNKPQEAEAKFSEASALLVEVGGAEHSDSWAAYLMASLMFDQGQYAEALPGFKRAAELNPSYAPAHQAVGATALALKEWSEAEDAYKQAIELDENDAEYQAGYGLALLGQKRVVEAREVLKKAWQMDRANVEALCGLGYIANLEKNEASMRDLFHQALACDGNCAYAAQALKKLYAFRSMSMEYLDFEKETPAGWSAVKGIGQLRPEVQEGVLLWHGQQGANASARLEFGTNLKADEFVRLEADLAIAGNNGCVMALRVGSSVGANVAFYFEFGKDESNRLAYRLQDYRGPREWTPLGPWPSDGKVRLAIESPDLASGQVQLYVNGEAKLSGKLELARLSRVFAGVFVQAPAKTDVLAYADNIVFISRKPIEAVPEGGPTELRPTEPTKAVTPDATKKDEPAKDEKKTDEKATEKAGAATP